MTTDIQREIHDFVATEIAAGQDASAIGVDDDLIAAGIVDSLGIQQLVEHFESRYGVRVDEADLVPENFQTVGALAAYVERRQRETTTAGSLRSRLRRR